MTEQMREALNEFLAVDRHPYTIVNTMMEDIANAVECDENSVEYEPLEFTREIDEEMQDAIDYFEIKGCKVKYELDWLTVNNCNGMCVTKIIVSW